MVADPMTGSRTAGRSFRGLDAPPGSLDWALVRRLHETTATALAGELKRRPTLTTVAQQELARTLIQDGIDELVRERMRTGQAVPTAAEESAIAEAVFAAQFGLGRLQPYIDHPQVENIEAHGHDNVWIGYADGRDVRVGPIADSDEDLVRQLQHIAARLGRAERTLTTASPLLTMRLPDGSRLAAVIETVPRPQLVIRRHRIRNVDLDDLIGLAAIDRPLAEFLRAAVRARKNIVVTGGQGAGKTLLLRALANELPRRREPRHHREAPRAAAARAARPASPGGVVRGAGGHRRARPGRPPPRRGDPHRAGGARAGDERQPGLAR
ncbi:ATPase, T2SS/T4P/T4SS family [Geodermatophilus sp. URMC 63]